MLIAEHRALADRGAQLVELRLDFLQRAPDVARLLKDRPTPVIVTCRRPADRGRWAGTEEQRRMLLRSAIVAEADYVDLEDDIAREIPRYGKTKRIISRHDFEETPYHLEDIHAEMARLDPDVIKLVTMANDPGDCVRMLELVANSKIPTVGFCMGEFGQMSRILCGKYGAPFTYATFSKERELAPGQLAFQEMRDVYHFEQINRETELFAVLGDPVGHSLSPLLHNTALRKIGYNGVYLPLRITQDQFDRTLDELETLKFRGFSVTIPHKEAALRKYPETEEIVSTIGAANTLYRDPTGQWRSDNTDYAAAMDSLNLVLKPGETLSGKRVLLLGAGGAARAIAYGVVRAGGALVIASRSLNRARTLAEQLMCRFTSWENRGSESVDLLINCTPVGMHPNVDETPFKQHWLREDMGVFDTIYNPEQTLLLKEAKERNCRTVSGIEMFVRQAAAQFERFTGHGVELDDLRETLRKGISAAKL
jgi:3-dehydroquinate dehydratase/shikimate dehydrogenase